ncbi:MAG: calcium-binding protein [Hyphomicrobiales bacterium]
MSYSTEGIAVDKGDVVTVRHAESVGFTNWIKIEYKGWQFGHVASDVENLTGGKNSDTLTGNDMTNTLIGGPGNDTLDGKGGQPDHLVGGPGNDTLGGGPAGSPSDVLDGGADSDIVTYASRTDGVYVLLNGASGGEDTILGVENAEGGSGDDHVLGTDGPNAVFGNGGNDNIGGSGGNDTPRGGEGADYMNGWNGVGTVTYDDYTVPVTVTVDGKGNDGAAGEGDNVDQSVEILIGGQKGDTLTGNDLANWIYGGPGNDKLFGLGGNDMLDGQAGTDTVDGAADTDTCVAETRANCEK